VTAVLDPHALGKDKRELEIVLNVAATTAVQPTTATSTTAPSTPSLLVRGGNTVLYRRALGDLPTGGPIRIAFADRAEPITIVVEPVGAVGGFVDLRSITAR
jgi:hypothetical protein